MTTRRQMLTLLPAMLPAALPAQTAGDEEVWKEFLDWLRGEYKEGSARDAYLARLAARFPQEEVKRRDAVIDRMMKERDDVNGVLFDKVYSGAKPLFRTEPNAFLVECVRGVRPGKALDVAMGQGRNAFYLAGLGWDTTGFDVSGEGVRVAQANALAAGVRLEALQAGWQQFDFGRARWDLEVFSYAFVPVTEPAFVKRVCESLRPGGLLVYEHFRKENGRGPKGSTETNRLREAYGGLEILRYEEAIGKPDWAQVQAPLVRMLARARG